MFLNIFPQYGYEGVIQYLRKEALTYQRFTELIVAVLLNRFKIFSIAQSVIIYEHDWYPFIIRAHQLYESAKYGTVSTEGASESVSDQAEHFGYKLFEAVLFPLFGRVDSETKARNVARVSSQRTHEIHELKAECHRIAVNVVGSDPSVRDDILRDAIRTRIANPLSAVLGKARRDVAKILSDFVLDSGIWGALLSLLHGADLESLGLATAAAALSAGFHHVFTEAFQHNVEPSALLVDEMRKATVTAGAMLQHLKNIAAADLEIPSEWRDAIRH